MAIACSVPPFPEGGKVVKVELDRACPITIDEPGQERSTCPAIDAWLARLFVFKQQLEVMP